MKNFLRRFGCQEGRAAGKGNWRYICPLPVPLGTRICTIESDLADSCALGGRLCDYFIFAEVRS